MIETPCSTDQALRLDQTFFALDADRFSAIQAVLEAPPAPNELLMRTLSAAVPWRQDE